MTKVSVILPIYNAQIYLEECLNSIINQTLSDLEIICVNDGSTDKSLEIIKKFAKKDSRIKVISQKNGGLGKAYNTGLANATGEYIGFVEPDDYIAPDMYENLYNCTQENKPNIVKSDWFLLKQNQLKKQNAYTKYKQGLHKIEDIPNFLAGNLGHWSAIYKNKDFIQKYNIRFNQTSGAAFQDIGFLAKAFILAKEIYILPNQYYYYRIHGNQSISASLEKKKTSFWIQELESIIKYFDDLSADINYQLLNCICYKSCMLNTQNKSFIFFIQLSKILKSPSLKKGYNKSNYTTTQNEIYKAIEFNAFWGFFVYILRTLKLLFVMNI